MAESRLRQVVGGWALRVRGYLFVYDSGASAFLRKPEIRTRVVPLDNRVIINVLPDGVSFDSVGYAHDAEGNLTLKDGADFELDVSEFSAKEYDLPSDQRSSAEASEKLPDLATGPHP
jgi:hypothetical protein